MINGGCGEVVNTAGCGPVMRGFEPHRPPHKKNEQVHSNMNFFYYINQKLNFINYSTS